MSNKITRLLPASMELKSTLAGRMNQLREFRNMTVRDLAKASRIKPQRVEDIESGLETWLSSTERQTIADALRVRPELLQEVEYRPDHEANSSLSDTPREIIEEMADAILHGERALQCPRCHSTLTCSVQEGIDLEESKIYLPMAYCEKCPFVLK